MTHARTISTFPVKHKYTYHQSTGVSHMLIFEYKVTFSSH